MKIDILTTFTEMFGGVFGASILGRATDKGILDISIHNIRDYSESKHKNTDDYTFGGGAGMVMMPQPVYSCIDSVDPNHDAYCIYMSPKGRPLTQDVARELSVKPHILILCGHYEGIDERIMQRMDDEISIGDYVLTGGELPAMVLVDCFARLIDGVLGSDASAKDESFSDNLLEYPQYTRPAVFRDMAVPEVLLNGNHAEIAKWRREQSIRLTYERRPELLKRADLTRKDLQYIERLKSREQENNE